MNSKRIFRVGLIIVLSIVLVLMINNIINQEKEQVTVFIANEKIPEMTLIKSSMVKKIEISFSDQQKLFPDACKKMDDIVGKLVVEAIDKNHVFTTTSNKYVDEGAPRAVNEDGDVLLGYFIPYGMKLMSFEAKSTNALNGILHKGDYIDIIFTSDSQELGGIYSSSLENHIEVFDVKEKGDRTIIFVIVSAQQAKNIALGKEQGVIDVVLASRTGDEAATRPSIPYDLFKGKLPSRIMEEMNGN